MRETGNHMTPERLAEVQARIKASSANVQTVNNLDSGLTGKRGPNVKPKRAHKRILQQMPESVVLRDCSEILDKHPCVAFWWRVNTGAMKMDNGRYVKFSFVGASDLMAVSIAGRFIAVECKATGKKPTEEQQSFLDNVTKAGGFACCVDHPATLAVLLREL